MKGRLGKRVYRGLAGNGEQCTVHIPSVTDILTAELERYKDQVRILKEGQNVELKSKDIFSDSCAQSVEIDNLKQTLSEHLKEKEIALEKQIKELNNIAFKRNQSTQTIHMLTKPQFFYDHTTKQALGLQTPFYLKKAQQLEPKLYNEPTPSTRPTQVEVPKELSKVSMVNTSLKKFKHHLASFDVVVKERTTSTAITEEKDMVIKKLKERIKSVIGKMKEEKIKKELEEIETINIELDHKVTKLIAENEHLKQTYKQLYDSIKSSRIRSKEQCDDLIKQVNLKSWRINTNPFIFHCPSSIALFWLMGMCDQALFVLLGQSSVCSIDSASVFSAIL
nr:hypothetical protein [Tanacetum cinerariifolium]